MSIVYKPWTLPEHGRHRAYLRCRGMKTSNSPSAAFFIQFPPAGIKPLYGLRLKYLRTVSAESFGRRKRSNTPATDPPKNAETATPPKRSRVRPSFICQMEKPTMSGLAHSVSKMSVRYSFWNSSVFGEAYSPRLPNSPPQQMMRKRFSSCL